MHSLTLIALLALGATAFADQKCYTGELDLVLVVDVSGSNENKFVANRDAAFEIARAVPISVQKASIAIIQYSKQAIMKLEFGSSETWEIVNDTLMNLEWVGDVSLTAEAMDLAMIQFRRGRPDAQRVIILFSDGSSFNTWQQLTETAERLEYSKAKIYAVYMAGTTYDTELHQYVDFSNGTIVKSERAFQQLKGELKQMTEPRCEKQTPEPRPTDQLRAAESNPDNVDIELPTRRTTRRNGVTRGGHGGRAGSTATTRTVPTSNGPFAGPGFPGADTLAAPIDKRKH